MTQGCVKHNKFHKEKQENLLRKCFGFVAMYCCMGNAVICNIIFIKIPKSIIKQIQ